MNYIQVPNEAFQYLSDLRSAYNQYGDLIDRIESSLNLRLWNQLSDDLIILTGKEELKNSQHLIFLYNCLISHVEKAFNPMKLILIIQNVTKNYSGKNYFKILRKLRKCSQIHRNNRG
jgi:hypothetical protein